MYIEDIHIHYISIDIEYLSTQHISTALHTYVHIHHLAFRYLTDKAIDRSLSRSIGRSVYPA